MPKMAAEEQKILQNQAQKLIEVVDKESNPGNLRKSSDPFQTISPQSADEQPSQQLITKETSDEDSKQNL